MNKTQFERRPSPILNPQAKNFALSAFSARFSHLFWVAGLMIGPNVIFLATSLANKR